MNKALAALIVGVVILAWVRYAEQPTARNLRSAIADTLML
jgi:hypothetical protein